MMSNALIGPDMVENLRNISATFINITVAWDELSCMYRNGKLTGYIIAYGTTTINNTVAVTGASNTTFTAVGLDSNTTYMFKVAGTNTNGTGVYSNTTTINTKELPPGK